MGFGTDLSNNYTKGNLGCSLLRQKISHSNYDTSNGQHTVVVAVTACVPSGKTFSDAVVRFATVTYKIRIDNIKTFTSSGKFVCEIPGLYYLSAHIRTTTQSHSFDVRKNGIPIARSASYSESSYSVNPISAVVELQLRDTLYVFAPGVYIQGTFSCMSIMKVG
ncbi:unnamed protein product [Mytilus edulis]|uniref:C1q domain-containing protein n=1 Tax=Mytilus edulis TaxID=6550 RepID=A0A8S3S7F2_MYTED|nr:unnamed protein product [Mytilus edulis]